MTVQPPLPSASKPESWWALVDMGSNGIRFSITDCSPSTARLLPLVEQARLPISLYDAQHATTVTSDSDSSTLQPIPDVTITRIATAIAHFLRRTAALGVPTTHTRILATEATRTAPNSTALRAAIECVSNGQIPVTLLPKEDEGRLGAAGVVSGFPGVHGLVAEIGGGSLQLSWVRTTANGGIQGGERARSLPYGAAALLGRLETEGEEKLQGEVVPALKEAVQMIGIPEDRGESLDEEDMSAQGRFLGLAKGKRGIMLYLTGGGFRGYGYALMSQQPAYPIPQINGYHVPGHIFEDTGAALTFLSAGSKGSKKEEKEEAHFRLSGRRIKQLPATAFLIRCLSQVLPPIGGAYFAQGGIREGLLYADTLSEERGESPLEVAARRASVGSTEHLQRLLLSTLPDDAPQKLKSLAYAASLLFRTHAALPKDVRAIAALRCAVTGELAGAYGMTHEDRAALGILLCERWGGKKELGGQDITFRDRLAEAAGKGLAWWCMLLGRTAAMIGELGLGMGLIGEDDGHLHISSRWASAETQKKKGSTRLLEVVVRVQEDGAGFYEGVAKAIKRLKKCGKKTPPAAFEVKIVVEGLAEEAEPRD